ncbi:unnamed protein product [Ascophyllum nodosum]
MYTLSDADKNNLHNQVLQGSADFKVQAGNRSCTDVIFLLLLCAAWAAMTALGLVVTGTIPHESLEPGKPQRLINGIDYNGRICGIDSGVEDRSKIYFVPSGEGVCLDSCPLTTNYAQFICYDEVYADIENNVTGEVDVVEAWKYVSTGKCLYKMPTTDILGHCVFDQVIDLADSVAIAAIDAEMASALNGTGASYSVVSADESDSDWFEDVCADLITARALVGTFGLGISALVGTGYLLCLRIPGILDLLVWGVVFLVFALFAAGGVALSLTSESWAAEEEPKSYSGREILAAEVLSYIMFVMAALWISLMLWLRTRIILAIAITKEAARAVNDMKALILFPVAQTVALIVFLVPWFIYVLYLASSGKITSDTIETSGGTFTVRTFTFSDSIRYAAWYLLFSYFWTSEFIVALGQIVIAMAVSTWYFTRDKKANIGTGTVCGAVSTSLLYHSGTAAFGSLIIATIKTIRAVVTYVQKKAKDSSNKLAEAILCCVQCFLWMLEKCMKFMNKNAYIQTAIFGHNFCTAAREAFFLVARNISRIAAVGMVSELVLVIGKVLIPLLSTYLFYVVADAILADQLHGLIWVTFVVFSLSIFTATMFIEKRCSAWRYRPSCSAASRTRKCSRGKIASAKGIFRLCWTSLVRRPPTWVAEGALAVSRLRRLRANLSTFSNHEKWAMTHIQSKCWE